MDIEKLESNIDAAEFDLAIAEKNLTHAKVIRDAFFARARKMDDNLLSLIEAAESRRADLNFAQAILKFCKDREVKNDQ